MQWRGLRRRQSQIQIASRRLQSRNHTRHLRRCNLRRRAWSNHQMQARLRLRTLPSYGRHSRMFECPQRTFQHSRCPPRRHSNSELQKERMRNSSMRRRNQRRFRCRCARRRCMTVGTCHSLRHRNQRPFRRRLVSDFDSERQGIRQSLLRIQNSHRHRSHILDWARSLRRRRNRLASPRNDAKASNNLHLQDRLGTRHMGRRSQRPFRQRPDL